MAALIEKSKLSFIYSTTSLSPDSLAKQVMQARLTNSSKSVVPKLNYILQKHSLPSLDSLLDQSPCSKTTWKNSCREILTTKQLQLFHETCSSLPLSTCSAKNFLIGKLILQLSITVGNRQATLRSNFRVRLLMNCHGLETDAARFRIRRVNIPVNSHLCRLRKIEAETPRHFLTQCNSLSTV